MYTQAQKHTLMYIPHQGGKSWKQAQTSFHPYVSWPSTSWRKSETNVGASGFVVYICLVSSLSVWIDFDTLCRFHTKSEHVICIWMGGYNMLIGLSIWDYWKL